MKILFHLSKPEVALSKLLAGFLFCLTLISCSKHDNEAHVTVIKKDEISQDVKIPKLFFEKISEEIKIESAVLEPVFLFAPLSVSFISENNQVLEKETRLNYLNGGGLVDLSKIISGQGSYYMYFPKEQFESLPELTHLYYVSSVPVQKIGKEVFGLGCGRWVDLQKKFKNFQKNDFLKLNTTDLRHLYASAGTYIFVFRKSNQVYLTHLKVTDSTNKKIFCPEIDEANLHE